MSLDEAMSRERSGIEKCCRAARWLIGAATAVSLLTGLGSATTVTFRQGENGYSGTRDTYVQQNPSTADANNGAAANLNWDGDDPGGTGYDVYTLLRFDSIFGDGAGQIPPGAQITKATLSYTVFNAGGDGMLHEAYVEWQDSATYNSFCGGECREGAQYGPQVGTAPAASTALQSADVTGTVQRWSSGATNRGWFVRTTETNGVDIRSSEGTAISERPLLRVVYDEGPPTSHLVREPYLQLVTPSSITVVWRTDVATDSSVRYGTVFGTYDKQATTVASGTDHYVSITGLTPATRYYYMVGSGAAQQGGGTAEHYFVTAPVAGTGASFRFWIFGDSGVCRNVQNQVRDSMLAYTATNPPQPDLFLHTGDVAQSSGTDAEYTDCHLAYYQSILRHTPFWPAMGNHDSHSSTCQDPGPCTGPYFSTFVMPTGAEAGGYPSGTEAYYSFDYGNTHFVVLNGTNVSRSSTGPMANWLRSDLAATAQQWVIAYWHQPPYTKGTHDSDTEINCIEMRQNINPILEQYGVDLVLNGHSHGYERSYLIDGTYSTPTPTYSTLQASGNIKNDGDGHPAGGGEYHKSPGMNPHEGTVYAVVATGGQTPGGPHGHPVMYYSESVNGSALVDVSASELSLTFLRSDSSVRDAFKIVKGELPPRVISTTPPKGSVVTALLTVQVAFNIDVTGVDPSDFTVNGSTATAVTPVSESVYIFSGYPAPRDGLISVSLAADGIAARDNPANTFAGDSWTYTQDTSPPRVRTVTPARGSVIGALPSVTVDFSKPVHGVVAENMIVNGSAASVVSGSSAGPYIFTGYASPANGLVTVVFQPGSIQDDQGQPFAGDTWNYQVTRRLVINEFLASNNTAATDEYGEFDDYLEIYNPTDAIVDMSGMYLTDDLDSKTQYRVPVGVAVPPRGHVVFWCDLTPSQGPLHTNFNILRTGEDLGLFDTSANGLAPIDTLTFTTQTTDIASGRFPDGADGFVQMPVTPGTPNTITCTASAECAPLTDACNIGECFGNRCVARAANEGGSCDDGIGCTDLDTCSVGVCIGGMDICPIGQTCNRASKVCETGPVTVTFQQGVNGYFGNVDTYIGPALGSQATTASLVIDGPDVEALLRFDGIVGPGAGQIPQGSTIVSATLTLRVGSDSNDRSTTPVNFHRLLHPWIGTDLWAAYGVPPWSTQGGLQADGVDAGATADATTTMSTASAAYPVSVTSSVQAWTIDPSRNYGWTILPTSVDGLRVVSAEATTASYRPLLSVSYNAWPPEVGGVRLDGSSPPTLTWESQGANAVYDLVSGFLVRLLVDEGFASATCLADDVSTARYVDTRPMPPRADGYYYLVRAANTDATGSYGSSSSGSERIPPVDCP